MTKPIVSIRIFLEGCWLGCRRCLRRRLLSSAAAERSSFSFDLCCPLRMIAISQSQVEIVIFLPSTPHCTLYSIRCSFFFYSSIHSIVELSSMLFSHSSIYVTLIFIMCIRRIRI